MDKAVEAARLAAIRRRIASLEDERWMLAADGEATAIDARGRDGNSVVIARFERLATPEEMEVAAAAPDDLRFLLDLVDRAIAAERARRGQVRDAAPVAGARSLDHTTEAAMLCSDGAFKRFLMDCHGLDSPATDERTAQRLRSLIGVTSRKEINRSDAARQRWIALRDAFRQWKGRVTA